MPNPVFIDQLPNPDAVIGQKPAQYRLRRNKALISMQLDEGLAWQERSCCPACADPIKNSKSFSRSNLEFRRCIACNTVFAAKVPDQAAIDQTRLDQASTAEDADANNRQFEYISLLNWISLSEARIGRRLDHILDVRFSTLAPRWRETTERLSHKRTWSFYPLTGDENHFQRLKAEIEKTKPKAILVPSELDRVADPKAFLSALKVAEPGTVLFIATSCADGLEYELLGADSPSFVPLDRLNLFSVKGFQSLVESLGFSVLEVSTPGRFDAVILDQFFKGAPNADIPFWSGFFADADQAKLHDLQVLLQRSLKSGVMRFAIEI